MTATIIRFLLAAWKPIAAILAGLGLYAKGRADAKAKADLRDAKAATETFERAANAPVHTDLSAAADRMRNRDPRKP
jgi:hypothetical protein